MANPKLAQQMAVIKMRQFDIGHIPIGVFQPAGQLREELQVPVAPVRDLTDALLYEDARDPAKKSFLPRYRLRENRGRYEIGVKEAEEGDWRLSVGLERFPAPELGASVQGASELQHRIFVFFRYNDSTLEHLVEFDEEVPDDRGVVMSTRLGLRERDYLLQAMNDIDASLRLVVRRTFTVAVQTQESLNAPAAPPGEMRALTVKAAQMRAAEMQAAPVMAVRERAMMATVRDHRGEERVRDHRVRDRRVRDHRGGIRLDDIQAEPRPEPSPAPTPTPPEPQPPRYEVLEHALEDVADPEPLLLDPRSHGYIYEGLSIGGGSQSAARYQRIPVEFPPGSHTHYAYLQDREAPWVFYYLPDRFKLAREDTPPFRPVMVEQVNWSGGAAETATVTVNFAVRPWTNIARLVAAAESLKRSHLPTGSARTEPELRPLPAIKTALDLWMPSPAGPVLKRQPEMAIDLAMGFVHSFTLPVRDLDLVRAAAFSEDVSTYFTGKVMVETGLDAPEAVDLKIRFADTVGGVLLVHQDPAAADGSIPVTVQNAIESPVEIASLPARVRDGEGREVAASIEGAAFAPPVRLEPAGEIAVVVRPAEGLGGDVREVVLDLSGTKILVDPDAIKEVIRGDAVPEQSMRDVTVTTFPVLWGDPADVASILMITVEFKDGGKATLKRSNIEQEHVVPTRVDANGNFQFKLQIVRGNSRTVDEEWREQSITDLVVPPL
jgi:hypothetical protein